METLVTYRGAIYPWHCDQLGHMNNMWYAGKFDEASWNLLLQVGITPSYLRHSGCSLASVEQNTTFKKELLAGDVIEVRSQVVEIREKVLRLSHAMLNAETGEVCATCAITAVHMDLALRKSAPFPDAIRASAQGLVVLAEAA